MSLPTWVPVACMILGVVVVLRSALLVATKARGLFRGDPLLTLAASFGLLYIGQQLLGR